MKLTQKIKIDDKEYNISELSVEEIITLVNDMSFFNQKEDENGVEKSEKLKIEDVSEDLVVNGILNQIEGLNLVKADLENMMKLCCDFTIKDLIPLAPSEIKQLIDVFREVNASFFIRIEKSENTRNPSGSVGRISYGLFKQACWLIEAGHTNILSYGFSYFIAALNEHQLIQGHTKKIIAIAVRASKASDKDFKKFLKRKD